MTDDKDQVQIYLALALKKISKRDRAALNDKDWHVREAAETTIGEQLIKALDPFEITLKPVNHPNSHRGHQPSSGPQTAPKAPSKPPRDPSKLP